MSNFEMPEDVVSEEPSNRVNLRVQRSGRPVGARRKEILQTVTKLLEDPQCDRITTALIAKKLKLSEAALYRSFPSKSAMFEGLLAFIESSLLGLYGQIRDQEMPHMKKAVTMAVVILQFADANPGLTRLMTGQVLMKEDRALTERLVHLFDSLETGIRQEMKEAVLAREIPADYDARGRADLVMSWVLGRLQRFVMSGFALRAGDITSVTLDPLVRP